MVVKGKKRPRLNFTGRLLLMWQGIYVFGFFDAPKGGQLPWYLRPIITFPLMFAVVGVAFSVVVRGFWPWLSTPVVAFVSHVFSVLDHRGRCHDGAGSPDARRHGLISLH